MTNDLLTTRQVIDLLKVDRITVYRMLQDGRLKGVKIGQQWRFPQREVERLLSREPAAKEPAETASSSFPTHCVQTVQELFSELSQIGAVVVDTQGEPLTGVTHACEFCSLMLNNPAGGEACRTSWRTFARQAAEGERRFTCHAGLRYVAAPVLDEGSRIGWFLSGQFRQGAGDAAAQRPAELSAAYGLDAAALSAAADKIPVFTAEQMAQVEAWPVTAARAVDSILRERTGFMNRLQQIANLSQIF